IFFAASKGASPLSGWWIYSVNVTSAPDDFWDFGGLGMDQDAVIITANNFNGASYVDSRLLTIAKAPFYNGRGLSIPMLTGLSGTLQPPIVLDQDAQTYVVAAEDNTTGTVRKYTLENTSRPLDVSIASSTISVGTWGIPPDASQPDTTDKVDTLDGRFQNASTQNGGMLWQTHTIGAGPFPIPKWYKLDVETDTMVSTGLYFVYEGSHDFNPSIAANADGDFFVTWAMTCPTPGTSCPNGTKNAQMRFSGKRVADPSVLGNNPTGAFGISSSSYADYRFGDYSAVSIDPVTPGRAWVTNEFFTGPTSWGSRIARIGY
ncbi:MAG: hypothetical protein HY899_04785, partial [Deltaproteobacteria bacterium]|nr:hypothetical protein [Deltaproteobacteria bacterium]